LATIEKLYGAVMVEVKERMVILESILRNRVDIADFAKAELAAVQVRKNCELIAMGCVIAHGDVPEASPLLKEWNLNELLKRIGKLNPLFYPRPFKPTVSPDQVYHIEWVTSGYLERHELLEAWGRCCDFLHSVSVRAKIREQVQDFAPIAFDWATKTVILLQNHAIFGQDGTIRFMCNMV
jgi:hypothetical protein